MEGLYNYYHIIILLSRGENVMEGKKKCCISKKHANKRRKLKISGIPFEDVVKGFLSVNLRDKQKSKKENRSENKK